MRQVAASGGAANPIVRAGSSARFRIAARAGRAIAGLGIDDTPGLGLARGSRHGAANTWRSFLHRPSSVIATLRRTPAGEIGPKSKQSPNAWPNSSKRVTRCCSMAHDHIRGRAAVGRPSVADCDQLVARRELVRIESANGFGLARGIYLPAHGCVGGAIYQRHAQATQCSQNDLECRGDYGTRVLQQQLAVG